MRIATRIATLTLVVFALLVPMYRAHASTPTLSINLEHDLDIRQLRGHTLTKFDGRKKLSTKTISNADFNGLVTDAKAFVNSTMKAKERDPDLGKNGEGKSHVVITVTVNGKKKSVEFESDVAPGSVDHAPAPFKTVAEKLRRLAP